MIATTRRLTLAGLLAIAAVATACGAESGSTPSPTVCDGVSSEMGGCTLERHDYTATTCDEVAAEWAALVDRQIIATLDGPAVVDGEAHSSRLKTVLVISAVDADAHIETLGLAAPCDVDAFLAIAEPRFTDDLRSRVGAAMYDGEPVVSYEEWLADVEAVLGVLRPE